MPDSPLFAHSLMEARLYLMVTPCPSCRQGPLSDPKPHAVCEEGARSVVAIDAACAACHAAITTTFQLPGGITVNDEDGPVPINLTDDPSRIIDVAQWLTLFRIVSEQAARESDKIQARRLGIEAAQCLEEALKFYDEIDNDLPPEEAFFHEGSRQRFRDNPEQFSRKRVINLRSTLPFRSPTRSDASSWKPGDKPRWWRRHQ